MGFRSNLKMKLAGCKTANCNVNVLGGGQAVNYAILQMAHRLVGFGIIQDVTVEKFIIV